MKDERGATAPLSLYRIHPVEIRTPGRYPRAMKIAKPLLLITTPIGLAFGLYEAHRLAGGLVFLMAAMIAVIGVAMASVVMTIRRERREEEKKRRDENHDRKKEAL